MKAERWVFAFVALFFFVVGPVYWLVAHEVAGAIALLVAGSLGAMISAYLWITGRHIDARPEDNKASEIADGAGDLGFFPPSSIWPFWSAVTLAIIALGPPFGWWISLLGAGFGIWALCGWVFEFYRGDYKH